MRELIINGLIVSMVFGVSTIFQKLLLQELSNKEVMYIHNLIYFTAINIYFYSDLGSIHNRFLNLDFKQCTYFFFLSVVCVLISSTLYYDLLNNHSPGIVSMIVSLNPLFTLAISYLIFQERLNTNQLLGVGLILSGTFMLSK